MFAEPYTEGSAGLTCVHLMARETFQLVNSTFLVFVGFWCLFLRGRAKDLSAPQYKEEEEQE